MSQNSRYNINITGGTFQNFIAGDQENNVAGDCIVTQNNAALSAEEQAAINELQQVVQDLQARYSTAEPVQQSAIIEAEFREIKQKQPWKWRNLLNVKRLLNGGKTAAVKAGEHLSEENLWGKAVIGFLEGVTEEVE